MLAQRALMAAIEEDREVEIILKAIGPGQPSKITLPSIIKVRKSSILIQISCFLISETLTITGLRFEKIGRRRAWPPGGPAQTRPSREDSSRQEEWPW